MSERIIRVMKKKERDRNKFFLRLIRKVLKIIEKIGLKKGEHNHIVLFLLWAWENIHFIGE